MTTLLSRLTTNGEEAILHWAALIRELLSNTPSGSASVHVEPRFQRLANRARGSPRYRAGQELGALVAHPSLLLDGRRPPSRATAHVLRNLTEKSRGQLPFASVSSGIPLLVKRPSILCLPSDFRFSEARHPPRIRRLSAAPPNLLS